MKENDAIGQQDKRSAFEILCDMKQQVDEYYLDAKKDIEDYKRKYGDKCSNEWEGWQ